ncbi:L,D-transpeptidase [Persicirhabdus sediminis]|uniref:L,D-transpeptidase n=1 Tax=Persicirhabdus sediminis TaxID=454144 RepID=A0A8J7MF54_9BACT|nr:L,D-transpeptidase [Persicirhabdus sediminis]MBK1791847.1 L,D-transpeptidase [Persicirhabdus sediminis]
MPDLKTLDCKKVKLPRCFQLAGAMLITLLAVACGPSHPNNVIVSVQDQQLLLVSEGQPVKAYPISTSKFGLGDQQGSMRTPVGKMEVAKKIGNGAPAGAVFKGRRRTGEVLRPNAPGRDPIVTRILWLKGKSGGTRNAYERYIYIHGTPEERTIGQPASYGCIRMRSSDIIDLYKYLGVGSEVRVIRGSLGRTHQGQAHIANSAALTPVGSDS